MSKRRLPFIYVPKSWENPAYLNAKVLSRTILSDFRNIDKIREYIDKREHINFPKESLLTETPTDTIIDDNEPPIAFAASHAKKGGDSHFSVAITALLIKKGAAVNGEAGTSAIQSARNSKIDPLEKLLKLHGTKIMRDSTKEKNPIVLNAINARIHEKNGEYAEAAALYLENANMSIQGANELHREHREFFNRQFYDENGNQRPECKYTNDCSDLIRDGILEYTIEHHLNPAIEALANTQDQETYRTAVEQKIGLLKILGGRDTEIAQERKKIARLSPPPVHILNQTFTPADHHREGLRQRTITRGDKVSSPSATHVH